MSTDMDLRSSSSQPTWTWADILSTWRFWALLMSYVLSSAVVLLFGHIVHVCGAIVYLAEHPDEAERFGRNAREHVVAHYTRNDKADAFLACVESTLNGIAIATDAGSS